MLGVAYKKDVDDPRESPSFELMEMLLAGGAMRHLQRPAHAALPPMRHYDVPDMASCPLTRGVPGRAGLRADRHRPFGLRLRVHRPPRAAGRRHAQRDQERNRGPREDRQGLAADVAAGPGVQSGHLFP